MYFHFKSIRISFISFISEVTRVHKTTTVVNDTSTCSTTFVLFLEIHPGRPDWNFPYEQTTKFVLVTEPARLPGSYEEARNSSLEFGGPDTSLTEFRNILVALTCDTCINQRLISRNICIHPINIDRYYLSVSINKFVDFSTEPACAINKSLVEGGLTLYLGLSSCLVKIVLNSQFEVSSAYKSSL